MGRFLALVIGFLALPVFAAADSQPTLTFKPNINTFKLSIFSDLHYGENEDSFGIPQDINSTKLMRYVLGAENPDLVVLNGDLITGENTFAFNSTKYVDVIVKPLLEKGYRWASTYGNHDSKYNLSREGIYAEERKYQNSLTRHGPPGTNGVTNYYIPIYARASWPGALIQSIFGTRKPLALLWFFDSRGGSQGDRDNNDNIPNWVSASTVAWFQRTAAALQNRYGDIPSLAFVHIPSHAFLELQQQSNPHVSRGHYPGLNADKPLVFQGPSAQNNGSYTGQDAPFMNALLGTRGLHSVYSGHDHGDSWCGRWPGDDGHNHNHDLDADVAQTTQRRQKPFLCFCKHSGFGGYGEWNRGVRQVRLSFDAKGGNMRVDTWVRMETGRVVTAVSLNETYGRDVYPTADGGYHNY